MLTSILPPVVHGEPHRTWRMPWLGLAALHSLGSVAAAVAVGGALAGLAWTLHWAGWRTTPWAVGLGLSLALLYLPRQLGWTHFPPLVQSTLQVPRRWAYDYPRPATALLFGVGLGSGCYTRIVVPTYYLLLFWPFFTPMQPARAVALWGAYGLARTLHVWWVAWTAPVDDFYPHVNRLSFALIRRSRWMHRVNALLLAATSAWLVLWRTRG